VFKRAAAAMLRIDPRARSSMYEDLLARRATEIDDLNGVVVRRGAAAGLATPINARVVELVRAAERAGRGSPGLSAEELAGGLVI
jgi:2-dehydropantoate 2-reductase